MRIEAIILLCYNRTSKGERNGVMAIENSEWIMRGMGWDAPARIRT